MFNCGQPSKWFFSSKNSASYGEFQKRRRKNATSDQIYHEIMKQRKGRVSDIIAYYVTGQRYKDQQTGTDKVKTTVEYLDEASFKEFMSPRRQLIMAQREELGFLQAFVDPKKNFLCTSRKNFVIRVQWSSHICLVNARVNNCDMDRTKKTTNIYNRAVTFEGKFAKGFCYGCLLSSPNPNPNPNPNLNPDWKVHLIAVRWGP